MHIVLTYTTTLSSRAANAAIRIGCELPLGAGRRDGPTPWDPWGPVRRQGESEAAWHRRLHDDIFGSDDEDEAPRDAPWLPRGKPWLQCGALVEHAIFGQGVVVAHDVPVPGGG